MRTWDLSSGKVVSEVDDLPASPYDRLVPSGPRRAAFVYSTAPTVVTILDLESGEIEGDLKFPANEKAPDGPASELRPEPLPLSPDGRLWWKTKGHVFTVPLPAPAADDEVLRPGGIAVAAESDCGNPERDRRVIEVLTARLRTLGYKVGPGGWKARLAAKVAAESPSLEFRGGKTVQVPSFRGTFQFLAPDGTAVVTLPYAASFPMLESRYHTKTSRNPYGGPNGVQQTDYFNFQGRDPEQAMTEETFDHLVDSLGAFRPPRSAQKSGGSYTAKERAIILSIPPEVAAWRQP